MKNVSALMPASLLLLLLPLSGTAGAQSAFTNAWFGEMRSPAPPRTLALGGLSAVAPWGGRPAAIGSPNPAVNALADRVRFGLNWEVGRLSGDYPDGEGSLWQISPRTAGMMAYLGRGVVAGVVLDGITDSEFEIHTPETSLAEAEARFDYRSTGGLNEGRVSLAWRTDSGRLLAGGSWNMVFGALDQEWAVQFQDPDYIDTSDELQRQHRGSSWSLGLQVEPLSSLRLGAAWNSGAVLDVKHIYRSTGAQGDTTRGELALGSALMAGAGWRFGPQWAVYADYRSSAWDRAAWDPAPGGGSIGTAAGPLDLSPLSAEWDMGVGVERSGLPAGQQRIWADSLPLRGGVRWGEMYVPDGADPDGGSVSRWYLTLGTALHIGSETGALVDLAFQYGGRSGPSGTTEGFWRLELGFSGFEEWFQPPQR
ncbi:MAG: hypothetical protein R6W82_04890 [bacterium]